jgi:hypothetical protein
MTRPFLIAIPPLSPCLVSFSTYKHFST